MNFGRYAFLACVWVTFGACTTTAEQKAPVKPAFVDWSECVQEIPSGPESPVKPYPRIRDYTWMSRNEWCTRVKNILEDPNRKGAELAFMGDSITQMWPNDLWSKRFSIYKPIRMGIGGDRTQTLLWRIDRGELNGLNLKHLVLLIGTNNLDAGDSPEEVTKGIELTIDRIRKYQPQVHIVLMAIFPREELPTAPLRSKIRDTNKLLESAAKTWKVDFVDIGSQLVEPNGTITKETMGDFVHLTAKGYAIWADAIIPSLKSSGITGR